MNILLPLKLAIYALKAHWGRTVLTILGIVIGIAAVIIVMSAGESIKGLVMSQVESFGSDFIQVEVKVPSTGKNSVSNAGGLAQGIQITTLKNSDAEAIGKLSSIKSWASGIMGQGVVSFLDKNKTVNYLAGSSAVADIMGIEVEKGRFFSDEEDQQLAKVVILGSSVAKDLFGNQEAVGQNVKIGKLKFKVIGVLKEKGGSLGLDFDKMAFVPVQTGQKLMMGIDYLMFITAKVTDANRQEETADEIISLLRDRHEIIDPKEDDFAVTTAKETLAIVNTVFGGITLLLVAIAGISLVVGGVGIMNIMYVSVTERTFEIGLRKSVGARPRQILWQFLWEAIVVTVFGGLVGIILGISFSFLTSLIAGQLGYDWQFILPPQSVLIAFSFCSLVGLVFGFYPAQKAARMNPINALGHE